MKKSATPKSSSSPSHAQIASRRRPKRPRGGGSSSINSNSQREGGNGRNRGRSAPGDTIRTTRSVDKTKVSRGEHRLPSQRLYHGVCPDVSNRYRKVGDGRIGQGTYGVVYCARDLWKAKPSDESDRNNQSQSQTNEIVALKKCYAHHEASDGFPITTLREIHALRICSSHPNVVDLLEIAVSSGSSKGESDARNVSSNSNDIQTNGEGKKDGKSEGINGSTNQRSTTKIGKSNVFLVFEHCRYDIAQILDAHHEYQRSNNHRRRRGPSSPFSLPQTKTLATQLLRALEFCHGHGLVHRDIKPSNLLYDTTTGRLKVCDFGLSRTASEDGVHMTSNVVSLWYRAPELLLKNKEGDRVLYSFPIDLWATGCVVAELLQGIPFLDGSSEIEQLQKMEGALGPPPGKLYSVPRGHPIHKGEEKKKNRNALALWDRFEHLPSEGLTFLSMLLEYNPNERWTATRALEAGFLDPASDPAPIQDLSTMPRGFLGC